MGETTSITNTQSDRKFHITKGATCSPLSSSERFSYHDYLSPIGTPRTPTTFSSSSPSLISQSIKSSTPSTHAFHSKIDLLSIDLQSQIRTIQSHVADQQSFLARFRQDFCFNPQLDLRTYSFPHQTAFTEHHMIHPISTSTIAQLQGLRIAAVDGGLGSREYLGLDLTLIKVAVVLYDFADPDHPQIGYFPPLEEDAKYTLYTDMGKNRDSNMGNLTNLRRILSENAILIKMLRNKAFLPNIILLDGSVFLPPESYLQSMTLDHAELVFQVMESYSTLFQLCAHHRIELLGSVKDSKATHLRDLILRSLPFFIKSYPTLQSLYTVNFRVQLPHFTDFELVMQLLEPLQRSCMQYHSQSYRALWILVLKSLQEAKSPLLANYNLEQLHKMTWNFDYLSVYLRFSAYDLPMRFEMVCSPPLDTFHSQKNLHTRHSPFAQVTEKNSKDSTMLAPNVPINVQNALSHLPDILSHLTPLSTINPQCTLPLPQIEAHLQAHLKDDEFNLILDQIVASYRSSVIATLPTTSNSSSAVSATFFHPFLEKRHSRLDQLF